MLIVTTRHGFWTCSYQTFLSFNLRGLWEHSIVILQKVLKRINDDIWQHRDFVVIIDNAFLNHYSITKNCLLLGNATCMTKSIELISIFWLNLFLFRLF